MKIFRWGCYIYLLIAFISFIYLGERYSYYITGLVGYHPTHSEYAQEDLKYYDQQSFSCKLGKSSFAGMKAAFGSNNTLSFLVPIVKLFCLIGTGDYMFCDQFFDSFGYPAFTNLMYRVFDVNYQCSYINVGDDFIYQMNKTDDYVKRMMKSRPPVDRQYPNQKPKKLIRMLQISDAHVDRGYLEGTNTDCDTPSGCRYQNGKDHGKAGYWGFEGRGDIPMRTAEHGFKYIVQKDIDFIIWTGDNIDHYIWYQTFENQFFNNRYLK